jgi:glycosyltransferase involved in cell wall biosynthesis
MRILMLSQFYPPFIGGEESHVHTLSTLLASRGHQVAVATIWHPNLPEFEQQQGVRIYRIRGTMQRVELLFSDAGHKHAPPFADPELTWALREIIEREQPEIVHAHNWLVHSFLPLKAWSGAKLVLSVHDHSVICPKKKLLYQDTHCPGPSLVKCLRCAGEHYGSLKGAVVALTNPLMSALERQCVDLYLPVSRAVASDNRLFRHALPVHVIPNFVQDDLERPRPDMQSYVEQLPSGEYMLFVGALARHKGVDVLLRAYTHLANPIPLVIIGYQSSEYPLRTVDFPVGVLVFKDWPHGAVLEAWRRSTLALVPSIWSEPFGIVAIEAMAMGRPVIASRTGGLTDVVVDGESGLLVPPGDEVALHQAMQRLLADPALRSTMGENGLRAVAKFRASAVAPSIEQLYRQVLAKQPERQPLYRPSHIIENNGGFSNIDPERFL